MKAVFYKEFGQYFKSMTGYLFLSVFWALAGAYFVGGNLMAQNGDIKTLFAALFPSLQFLLPILTMRLFSEEKKLKTEELLLTAPVSIAGVILGKFFATMAVFLAALAGTVFLPALLALWGSLDPLAAFGNYLGILLMAGAFVSVGLLISVLTDSQLVAAVFTYAVLLALNLADALAPLAPGFLRGLLAFLSPAAHYAAFPYGVFDPADAVYFLSVTALFLFFSVYALERRRIA